MGHSGVHTTSVQESEGQEELWICDHPLPVPVNAAVVYMRSLCPWSLPNGTLSKRGQALGLDTSCWLRAEWAHPLCEGDSRESQVFLKGEMTP